MFRKIKFKDGKVELEWGSKNGNDDETHVLSSLDEPEPEFLDALRELGPIAVKLLALPEEYVQGLTVLGVTLTENETQGRGCVITMKKELGTFNAPLILNTPHLAEDPENGPSFPPELSRALDELEVRAIRFRKGQRLQMDAFA